MSTDVDRRSAHKPPATLELASALLVPAATFGFIRLFIDPSIVLPLILASLISSGLAIIARRLGFPLVLSFMASAIGLALIIMRRFALSTLRSGVIPTEETLTVLREMAVEGMTEFQTVEAPVEAFDPFIAAAITGVWSMAFLTDWGASRLRLAFEPVLPSAVLFVLASALGSGQYKFMSTIVYASAVGVWAITQRVTTMRERSLWLDSDRRRGPAMVVERSAALAILAITGGLLAAPLLPGASADAWYDWRDSGDGVREVISPFVSIQAQLSEQASTQLFTVTADRPSYWRLAGLDNYADGIWSTRGTFEEEEGGLPGALPIAGTTLTINQRFEIEALAAIWLPAAFAPSSITTEDGDVTWNSESNSLSIDSSRDTSDGLVYEVTSVVGVFTADELRQSDQFEQDPSTLPEDFNERFLGLPLDLTPRVQELATSITQDAPTTYDQMIALQEHFRTYDYSIRLSPREGDPIEQFLDERVGFCQQFAGTYALMARSLGVPARVAVGFTWGDPVAGQEGTYAVNGRQAHAWPEVYFPGNGWVAFEPTPGRGAPDALYNPVAAAQDSPIQPDRPGEPTTTVTSSLTVVPPTGPALSFDPALGIPDESGAGALPSTSSGTSWGWLRWLAVAAVAYLVVAVVVRGLRRARRAKQATTPRARIELAWAEAAESVEDTLGLVRPPAKTRREWAQSLSRDRRVPGPAIARLADAVTLARYGDEAQVSDELANESEQSSAEVCEHLGTRLSKVDRLRLVASPRRLVRPTQRPLERDQSVSSVAGS